MSLTDWLRKIISDGPNLEDMPAPKPEEMRSMGLPTTWRDKEGKHHLRGPDTPIVAPNGAELEHYAGTVRDICGTCKFFELKDGQKKMVEEKFLERLVHDERWNLNHMGAPIEYVGICGASGGELATTFVSKACDQYRPRSGRR